MTVVDIELVLKVFVVNSAILPVDQPMDAQKGCVLRFVQVPHVHPGEFSRKSVPRHHSHTIQPCTRNFKISASCKSG